jgi:predicted MPP superfamily phosphohydrolase
VDRRLAAALAVLGAGHRARRFTRYLLRWLLYGYPVTALATVSVSLLLGREQLGPPEHPLVTWGLIAPFFLAALAVAQSAPFIVLVDAVVWVRRKLAGTPRTVTPRRAIATLVPLVGFALYTPGKILWEHGVLHWRHHSVSVGTPGAPAAPPFRIGFIADVQLDEYFDASRAREVVTRLNQQRLDVVLSGGDWINIGPDHIAAAADIAASARSRLGTFSVRGDHEHFAYLDRKRSIAEVTEAMRSRGVGMLHNEVRRFEHHGRAIAVAFLTYSYPARTPADEIARLIAAVEDADVSVLVTHQLDDEVATMVRDRVDVVLAAHTHGGQMNPVFGVWHVPLARIETPFVDGRYQLGATTIVVTAGVGYSVVPLRYAAIGSVDVIELVF